MMESIILSAEEVEMPYKSNSDLPKGVKNVLPKHAQDIYREAYNSAWDQYDTPQERRGNSSREETSHRVAWAAVKNTYEKNDTTGKWRRKKS
jgi:cation transport regulator